MLGEHLRVLAPGIGDARHAALIRVTHYHPRTCELSFADCFLLAAPTVEDRIATRDPAVLTVASALGIATVDVG